MMSKKNIILYILTVIILFTVPIYTIYLNTGTLEDGTEFLFKVRAYDPYDAFRGNYLDITFEEEETHTRYDEELFEEYRHTVYATIKEGPDGFAYFDEVFLDRPEGTSDYYKTEARESYSYYDEDDFSYTVDTPTRYYMNENKSLDAEKVYDENIDSTYVKVRVKDGLMVIVGVYVDDILIDTIEPEKD